MTRLSVICSGTACEPSAKEIPVHITYFTTIVDDDGKVRNLPDIYGLDSRIATALAGKPVNIAAEKPEKPEKAEKVEKPEKADDGEQRVSRSKDPGVRAERQLRPRATRVAQPSPNNPFSGLFGN